MTAISDLPFNLSFIEHAIEKEKESCAWDMYLTVYPNMGKDNFVNFNDYKDTLFTKKYNYTQKTNEEILKEMVLIAERGR